MPEQGFDRSIPCLCCDVVVLIRSVDWAEKCVGLCMQCYHAHSNETIRLIYFLRCQIAAMHAQIKETLGKIVELEEAVFEPA